MALGSCGHRITHQLRPIHMNRRSILSVTSTRGRSLQLQAAPDRSYRDRGSTNGSRLKPLRRRFRTTENTQNSEKDDTQDAVKAKEEVTPGDRQDQEIATRGSGLQRRLSAPGHLCWSQQVGCVAKTHREAERC